MGVGHWSYGSRDFETEVIHVDQLKESFADYQKEGIDACVAWLNAHRPDIFLPNLSSLTPQEIERAGNIEFLQPPDDPSVKSWEELVDEYPFLNDESGFYQEKSGERIADFESELRSLELPPGLKTVSLADSHVTSKYAERGEDRNRSVLAKGRHAQVVLRYWEDMIFIGIGPTPAVENDSQTCSENVDGELDTFLARCWAACDPSNSRFVDYVRPLGGPAPVELRPSEIAVSLGGAVAPDLLACVVDRAAKAAELIVSIEDQNAEEYKKSESSFKKSFGISPKQLLAYEQGDELGIYVEFTGAHDSTPMMLQSEYENEFATLKHAVLDRIAALGEEPMRPDSAWTSKAVDLSAYQHTLVVQLDADEVAIALLNPGRIPMMAADADPKPFRSSFMATNVYDRTVVGAVQQAYPVKIDLNPSTALYLRSEADKSGGAMVWTGHASWLAVDPQGTQRAWLARSESCQLGELPGWMSLVTGADEIRETLSSLAAPAEIARNFYTEEGNLDVTGLLLETRDGEYGAAFVCYGARPFANDAGYEPVLLGGQWNVPSAENNAELGHG